MKVMEKERETIWLPFIFFFSQGGGVKGQEVIIAVGQGKPGHDSFPPEAFQWEFDRLTSN